MGVWKKNIQACSCILKNKKDQQKTTKMYLGCGMAGSDSESLQKTFLEISFK